MDFLTLFIFFVLTYQSLSNIMDSNSKQEEYMSDTKFEKVLNINEVSEMIGYSSSWLYKNLDKGPCYHRVTKNGKIRYFRSDVLKWLEVHYNG